MSISGRQISGLPLQQSSKRKAQHIAHPVVARRVDDRVVLHGGSSINPACERTFRLADSVLPGAPTASAMPPALMPSGPARTSRRKDGQTPLMAESGHRGGGGFHFHISSLPEISLHCYTVFMTDFPALDPQFVIRPVGNQLPAVGASTQPPRDSFCFTVHFESGRSAGL